MYVDPALIEYAVRMVTATRTPKDVGLKELEHYIMFGASPRASINLILTGRALAFVRGRNYVLPQDVLDMALDVMRHRLVLSYEALSDNVTGDDLLKKILDRIPIPVVPYMSAPTSASTPERILQRLDWQVIRRWMACCRATIAACSTATGWILPICANISPKTIFATSIGTSPRAWTRPTCRQYVEDREITAWFLLDLSPSVDFGTADGERLKRTVLIDFVTTLARLLTRHGNRVGAIFYGSRVERRSRRAAGACRCCG